MASRMAGVEYGSARILSDTIIQTNLTDIMDAPTSIRNAQRKQTIYQALYPYIFDDDYIKSISLILPDDTLICMGNTSDLDAFPLEELAENAAACQGRATETVIVVSGVLRIRESLSEAAGCPGKCRIFSLHAFPFYPVCRKCAILSTRDLPSGTVFQPAAVAESWQQPLFYSFHR